jgi:NADH dehydrogenase (ubiquinone) 1 alpha/beta subcomplex 1
MIRTAILRSALAARCAFRPFTANSGRQLAIASRTSVVAPRSFTWADVRCYATSGGLQKQEVEGRIMALLKGFDKVRTKYD